MNTYRQMLNNLAWASTVPYFRDRTMVVCYRNLTTDLDVASRTVDAVHQFFLYGGSNDVLNDNASENVSKSDMSTAGDKHVKADSDERGRKIDRIINNRGSHSSGYSHDPELRRRLVEVVRDVDMEHYDGDIAWIDSCLLAACR